MKAFLLLNGATTNDLKKVGHSLRRAIQAAEQAGLVSVRPSAKAKTQLDTFDRLYRDKRFEYFSSLDLFLPATTHELRAFWRYSDLVYQAVLRDFLPAA